MSHKIIHSRASRQAQNGGPAVFTADIKSYLLTHIKQKLALAVPYEHTENYQIELLYETETSFVTLQIFIG